MASATQVRRLRLLHTLSLPRQVRNASLTQKQDVHDCRVACCSTSRTPCARTTLPWQQVEVHRTVDHPADVLGSEADQRGLWDLPDGWSTWRCHPASRVNVHVILVRFFLSFFKKTVAN